MPREPYKYLTFVYPANLPALPADLTGKTFSAVFGAKTSATEHFVLKRKLMGPCWIEVRVGMCVEMCPTAALTRLLR